jgi:type IV pilus assembly protein PilV
MRKQNGFAMLEVLVTIVIITFGLLGIAGLIASGLKANHSSYARSQASWLANDIIDSMRANRAQASLDPSPYSLAIGAEPAGAGIPLEDMTAWRLKLASALPSGTGSVAVTPNKVTVTVQWDDSRANGGSSTQQLAVETKL